MTQTTLAHRDHMSAIADRIGKVFMASLMVLCLFSSGSLLSWAINTKLKNVDEVTGSVITAEVRERQLACLAKNIYHEAGWEPFEGKVAVAQVTINRTNSGQFPEDICMTIYQKNFVYSKIICQFSWACEHDTSVKPINKAVYTESMEVAKKVLLEGFRLPGLKDALYYHADYINPRWPRTKIAHIGHHIFYR